MLALLLNIHVMWVRAITSWELTILWGVEGMLYFIIFLLIQIPYLLQKEETYFSTIKNKAIYIITNNY